GEGVAHRDLAVVLLVEVLGLPDPVASQADLDGLVTDSLAEVMPVAERGRVHEGLERAAHLAPGGFHAVEARLVEVAAAHPGQDVSAADLEGDDRSLEIRRAAVRGPRRGHGGGVARSAER